jgi:hypothetical protein
MVIKGGAGRLSSRADFGSTSKDLRGYEEFFSDE